MMYFWLIILYLSFIFLGASVSSFSSIWPSIAQEINTPEANLGIFMGILLVFTVIHLTLASFVINKIGARNTLGVGVIFLGIGLFVLSIARSFSICLLASAFLGIGSGLIDTTANYYVTLHYKPRYMPWLHCFWGFGSALGPFFVGILLSMGFGFNFSFRVFFPFYFVLGILILVSRYIDDKRRKDIDDKKNKSLNKTKVNFKEIFTTKYAILFFLMMFGIDFLMNIIFIWWSTYVTSIYNIDVVIAAKMVSVFFIGVTISRFSSGFLVDLFGTKRVLSVALTTFAIASIVLFVVHSANQLFLYVIVLILGLSIAPGYPLVIDLAKSIFGVENLKTAIGLAGSSAQFGSCISSVSVGFLSVFFTMNVFTVLMIFVSILSVVGCFILLKGVK